MELFSLLHAHAEWVSRLREALYGDGVLNEVMAADDEACQLGQWLKDMEPRYAHLPEYWAAKAVHAGFHHRAAHCMDLIDAGRRIDALVETQDGGELRRLSRLLVKALQRLDQAAASPRDQGRRGIDGQTD
jgi:hypothetical protein